MKFSKSAKLAFGALAVTGAFMHTPVFAQSVAVTSIVEHPALDAIKDGVQESLTNVGRHAPGADSTVIVDAGDSDALHLTVRNTSPTQRHDSGAGGSGLGILGMSERAALVGGSLDFGPTDDNGWVTHMRIPFDPDRGNR